MLIVHKKVSAQPDGLDDALVQPTDWNDGHELTLASARLIGRTTAEAGAAEEITVGAGLSLGGLALSFDLAWGDARYSKRGPVGVETTMLVEDLPPGDSRVWEVTKTESMSLGFPDIRGTSTGPGSGTDPLRLLAEHTGTATDSRITVTSLHSPLGGTGPGDAYIDGLTWVKTRNSFDGWGDWREVIVLGTENPAITNWDTAYGRGDHAAAGYAPAASPAFTGRITEEVYSVTGTTPALDPQNGTIQTWVLSANSTPTFSAGFTSGSSITLMIGDGPSGYAVTWPGTLKWAGGSAPTLGESGYNVVEIWRQGTDYYAAYVGNTN
ncbi:hypothetical protein [Kineobactrum salinum]|uniref:Uncharacterized protein n=1 Tax=Kineobactrum salinum TaxID=2708301 RepID=A0A6C0U4Z3_9GAMM|nr:hypothetical protein [Kineobactrum salinum]QIB67181.1 hypothetical protein G3T16_18995 [Kineobactrum salinum]